MRTVSTRMHGISIQGRNAPFFPSELPSGCTQSQLPHILSKLLPVTQIHTMVPLARPNGIDPTLTPAQMRVMQLRCYERGNVALGTKKSGTRRGSVEIGV